MCLRYPSSYGYSEQICIISLKPSFGKKWQLIGIKMHRHCQESCEKEKTSGAKNKIESHQKRKSSEKLAQRFPKPEYVYVHIFYSAQISPLKAKRVHSVGLNAELSMMAS